MNKQTKMLMSAERAIKRLAKLAWHINSESLAAWMIQGDKLGECRAGDAHFVLDWLEGAIAGKDGIQHYEYSKPDPTCVICGKSSNRFDKRKHTRYCSDRCRQKAYRMRYGSKHGTCNRTVTDGLNRYGSSARPQGGSVTTIWHDDERFASHSLARTAWLQRNSRHRESSCDA